MSYHGILADVEALENAIESLPTQCLYHGDKIELADHSEWDGNHFALINYDGACCATGKQALYRRQAVVALQHLRENL